MCFVGQQHRTRINVSQIFGWLATISAEISYSSQSINICCSFSNFVFPSTCVCRQRPKNRIQNNSTISSTVNLRHLHVLPTRRHLGAPFARLGLILWLWLRIILILRLAFVQVVVARQFALHNHVVAEKDAEGDHLGKWKNTCESILLWSTSIMVSTEIPSQRPSWPPMSDNRLVS